MEKLGFDEEVYLDFHRKLAIRHKVLQHTEAKKSFFGDDADEFTNTENGAKGKFVMNMSVPTSTLKGSSSIAREMIRGGFELMGKISEEHATNYREKERISSLAKQYGLQIIAAIGNAVFEGDCEIATAFDINEVFITKVYYSDGWVGYQFTYPLGNADNIEFEDSEEFFDNLSD